MLFTIENPIKVQSTLTLMRAKTKIRTSWKQGHYIHDIWFPLTIFSDHDSLVLTIDLTIGLTIELNGVLELFF